MEIPNNLLKEINSYCKVNKINDVDKFIIKMLKQGFNIEKYGIEPNKPITPEVPDKIKEVKEPVEKKPRKTIKKPEDNQKKDLYGE